MRPLVFALSLVALLFVVLQVASDSRAYNDGNPGDIGTHYAHCAGDNHHGRRSYNNYSEQNLTVVSRYAFDVPQNYRNAYLYAAVYWNIQATRFVHTPGTQGSNLWDTYHDPTDGSTGRVASTCLHSGAPPHLLFYSHVRLNRAVLDPLSQEDKQTVALHELGHEMTLGHSRETVGGNPIGVMYTPSLLAGFDDPQTDDVCGVNAIYRSNTYPVTIPPCHGDHWLVP
jgi:hypothetical protein